jgi:tetratricopeptide (TPR) repeat protein
VKSDNDSRTIAKSLVQLRDERLGDNIPQKCYRIVHLLAKTFCAGRDFKNSLIFHLEMLRLYQIVYVAVEGSLSWKTTTALSTIRFNIAFSLRNLNRVQDAVEYLTQVLTVVYSDSDVATTSSSTTSKLQVELVQVDNGVNIPRDAAPLYFRVWEEYGYNQYLLRLYDDALLSFQIAMKLNRNVFGISNLSPRTMVRLAMVHIELKQPDKAMAAIRDILTKDLQLFQDVYNLALEGIKHISSLFESEGDLIKAIDALRFAISIQDSYLAADEISQLEIVGQMLYQIAEMLQSMNQLTAALQAVSESVYYQRRVVNQTDNGVLSNSNDKNVVYVYTVKRLILALQLLGSLHYEMGELLRGQTVLKEAAMIANNVPISLIEAHEAVECLHTDSVFFVMVKFTVSVLANECCAPEA